MKTRSIIFAVSALFAFAALTACGEAGGESSGDSISLEVRTNDNIGFTIQVPADGRVLADSEFGYTVSHVLPDGLNEVNVSVNPAEAITFVEALEKDLETIMVKNIVDSRKTSQGFLAVAENPGLVSVYHRVGGVQAKVTVPLELRELAEKIALSLQAK